MKMPLDIKDYIAITASLLALFLTLYWNIWRGAAYRSAPLRSMLISLYQNTDIPFINLPLVISNVGGKTGVIDSLYAELTRQPTKKTGKKSRAIFYAVAEERLSRTSPQPALEEELISFSIQPGESAIRYYTFAPGSLEFRVERGLYQLVIYAITIGRNKPVKLVEQSLNVLVNLDREKMSISCYNPFPKKTLDIPMFTSLEERIQPYTNHP
ncbi:MAG: hypothetical protein RBJ76_28260 [Stenomitos frigidus ULC029]